MKQAVRLLLLALVAVVLFTGCNKRCRCTKYNFESVYYTKEEVKALGKTCPEMRLQEGLHTAHYAICEWVYGE